MKLRLSTALVWGERVAVFVGNLAVNYGFITAGQENAITGGGIIGAITLVQIIGALVSHKGTITNPGLLELERAYDAAKAAGKAS